MQPRVRFERAEGEQNKAYSDVLFMLKLRAD